MAEAIFGPVGVVVGGLVTGAVEWWHTRQERRIASKAAVRLVAIELTYAGVALQGTRQFTESIAEAAESLRQSIASKQISDDAWRTHNTRLGGTLDAEVWDAVAFAYTQVTALIGGRDLPDEPFVAAGTDQGTIDIVQNGSVALESIYN